MSKTVVVGGSAEDRGIVIGLFEAYLDANSTFDWERLGQDLWSSAPEATFFNLNGHTYHGRDHWVSLWKYYKQHMDTGVWTPFDVGGVVGSDVAVIWCERHTKLRWVGSDPRPAERHEDQEFHFPLDDVVSQGCRRLAGRSRPFLAGEHGRTTRRHLISDRSSTRSA